MWRDTIELVAEIEIFRKGDVEIYIDPRIDKPLYFPKRIIAPSREDIDADEYLRRAVISVLPNLGELNLVYSASPKCLEKAAKLIDGVNDMLELICAVKSCNGNMTPSDISYEKIKI